MTALDSVIVLLLLFSDLCPSYCMLAQILAQFWHFVADLKETVSQHSQVFRV